MRAAPHKPLRPATATPLWCAAEDRPRGVAWRRPPHPGWLLWRYCLAPLKLSQSEAARLLGMSRRRLHELVHGQRTMTPDTALRCGRQFGIAVDFWLARQASWDAFEAWHRQWQTERSARLGRPHAAPTPLFPSR